MSPYRRFDAWKRCHELAVAVYKVTKDFPRDERFGLTSQLRRGALSASTNIAEGACKRGRREFARYLDIAIGSLGELSYLIEFTKEVQLLRSDDWKQLNEMRERASIVTWRLYRKVRNG
ncbi:MAG: four helix bundle protein [Gemmatimonadota bacterium]|nr:MAG: four helix bundle protein [Gemmatimonadota bacterium]